MTPEEKVAGAAEILQTELVRRGTAVTLPEAVAMARVLYNFYTDRVQVANGLQPGDVAQRFRERYEQS
jgi:hypothetical protein